MPNELPSHFEIDLPPEIIPGNYADFANVWHTPTVFVMDFVTLAQPPHEETEPESGEQHLVVPARVVSRIRIPPEQVFELAKALTQQLEQSLRPRCAGAPCCAALGGDCCLAAG